MKITVCDICGKNIDNEFATHKFILPMINDEDTHIIFANRYSGAPSDICNECRNIVQAAIHSQYQKYQGGDLK